MYEYRENKHNGLRQENDLRANLTTVIFEDIFVKSNLHVYRDSLFQA